MDQKLSKNIYLAATPIHLICIKEYIKKKEIKEYELILFLHNTKKPDNELALKQIFLTLDILNVPACIDFSNPFIFARNSNTHLFVTNPFL